MHIRVIETAQQATYPIWNTLDVVQQSYGRFLPQDKPLRPRGYPTRCGRQHSVRTYCLSSSNGPMRDRPHRRLHSGRLRLDGTRSGGTPPDGLSR
jgi:hypothetical protein